MSNLLGIGDKMNEAIIDLIMSGYAKGSPSEQTMINYVFAKCMDEQESKLTATMLTAALFTLARKRKWDLVLVRPDGTRVIIPCDTEEEQTARALEIAKGQ